MAEQLTEPAGGTAAGEPDAPGFRLVERRGSYDVLGGDLQTLREQMRAHQQHGNDGPSSGMTTQHIDLSYELDMTHGACRLKDLLVVVEVKITLPHLKSRSRLSREERERWDRMISGLTRHEEGHRDNAVRAGREVHRRLTDVAMNDCRALKREAQRVESSMILKMQMRDQLYDQRTAHGVRQGSEL